MLWAKSHHSKGNWFHAADYDSYFHEPLSLLNSTTRWHLATQVYCTCLIRTDAGSTQSNPSRHRFYVCNPSGHVHRLPALSPLQPSAAILCNTTNSIQGWQVLKYNLNNGMRSKESVSSSVHNHRLNLYWINITASGVELDFFPHTCTSHGASCRGQAKCTVYGCTDSCQQQRSSASDLPPVTVAILSRPRSTSYIQY